MKLKQFSLFLIVVFTAILIASCSKDSPVQSTQSQGGISLKLNKSEIPSDVALVTVTLTRENYDSVYAEMDILNDSTAEVTLNDVPVGIWHLLIEAKDVHSTVIYRGETNFEIYANSLSVVNLALMPVDNQQYGSVLINVTWGSVSTVKFTDYYANPIFADDSNGLGIAVVNIVKVDSLYNIYYCESFGNGYGDTRIAYSNDGLTWKADYGNNTVLSYGVSSAWDGTIVAPGTVFYHNNSYEMIYQGRSEYGKYNFGKAYSQDGVNWQKGEGPLLELEGAETYSGIGINSALFINGKYYAYYGYTISNGIFAIGLATSEDGHTFTRYAGNPILTGNQSWESYEGVFYPGVYYDNGAFYMVYQGRGTSSFGLAKSYDGKTWVKYPNNPIFSAENTSWSYQIAWPSLTKINSQYRIYYCGYQNSKLRVGVATSPSIKF